MNDIGGGAQNRLRESISALVDGEADELELRRVLASTEAREVRETWRDYHLQRDMLAGGDMRFAQIDISQRVQAALVDEALPAAAGAAAGSRWWRPFASVAVAASVATVVVIASRSLNAPDGGGAAVAQVEQPALGTAGVYPAAAQVAAPISGAAPMAQLTDAVSSSPPMVQKVSLNPDQFARERLQQYLLRHAERASFDNGQGVITFAKVSDLSNAQ